MSKARPSSNGSDFKRSFGNAVKVRRKELELSQDELSWRAGVHRTYITNVERGICNPSLASIFKIARALGISAAALLGETESQQTVAPKAPVDILLVEDDPGDIELAAEGLRSAGLTNNLHIVRDGAEALDYFFSEKNARTRINPRLILLDLNLPKISGLEVLRRLKADKRTASIPVIVLTVSRTDRDIVECRRLGAEYYIVKPVNFQNLSEVTPQLNLGWLLLQNSIRAAA